MPWMKGVVANGFVFLTGLDGIEDAEGNFALGIEAQTHLALDRGKQWLEEAGSSFENVVVLDHYLANVSDLAEYHSAREAWLAKNAPGIAADGSYGRLLAAVQHGSCWPPDRVRRHRRHRRGLARPVAPAQVLAGESP